MTKSTDNNVEVTDEEQLAAEVVQSPANEWILKSYLPYAVYTILDRALILEDGFKPVNRRILWALYKKGVTPRSAYLKASIAASEANKYHPHGDASIQKALARMAQGFVQRVPLIDPYGSVGMVSGDVAAAARYWECRLSEASVDLVKDIDEGGLEVGVNFDGSIPEPHLLPSRWPVGIINGTQGIAVGYASMLYPHNPTEVMDAAIKLVDNPDMTIEQLMSIIKGPDFPTGGELFGIDGVEDYMRTGTGTFTLRGRYNVEPMPRGKHRIIFYELPYKVSAESVIAAIHKAQATGKSRLNDIADMKDLTDRKYGLRLRIETKAGSDVKAVLAEIFKATPAESKFAANSTVIVDGAPKVQGMLELMNSFINFRRRIVCNKANHRLSKIDDNIEQIEAILTTLVDIDAVIKIIRESETAEEAEKSLMARFDINKRQSEYILSMQLRRLTKSDSIALQKNKEKLLAEKQECEDILNPDGVALNVRVKEELRATKKIIADERKTVIFNMSNKDLKEQAKEQAKHARASERDVPCYITRLRNGKFVRTPKAALYHENDMELKFGPIVETIKVSTQSEVAVVFSDGTAKRIPANYFPENRMSGNKDLGFESQIVGISKTELGGYDVGLAVVTTEGEMKIAKPDFGNKDELIVAKLNDGDSIFETLWLSKSVYNKKFVLVCSNGNACAFNSEQIRVTGSKSGTVKAMKVDKADKIVGFGLVDSPNDTFIVTEGRKTIKVTPVREIPVKGRGGVGVVVHKFKSGETKKLRTAFVGKSLIACMGLSSNVISLPSATKRGVVGTVLDMSVVYGSYQA